MKKPRRSAEASFTTRGDGVVPIGGRTGAGGLAGLARTRLRTCYAPPIGRMIARLNP